MFWMALAATGLAGIGGTGMGGAAACLLRRDSPRMVSLLLSFAAGVMTAVVCCDLLAEAVGTGDRRSLALTAAAVLAGHGAVEGLEALLERRGSHGLAAAGVVLAAAVALHNVPEGMVIGAAFAARRGRAFWWSGAGSCDRPAQCAGGYGGRRAPACWQAAPMAGGSRCRGHRSSYSGRSGSGLPTGKSGARGVVHDAGRCLRGHAVCGVWRAAARSSGPVAVPGAGLCCGIGDSGRTGDGIWIRDGLSERREEKPAAHLCGGFFAACSRQTRMQGAEKGMKTEPYFARIRARFLPYQTMTPT